MTISGSSYNLPQVTPSIFEKETAGQISQKNTGEVRGNVTIVPQSQTDDISFTKMDDHNKWDYKAEQERPALRPNNVLRGAGSDIQSSDEGVKAQLSKLYDQLPDDTKLELAGLPTVYTAALKFVLDLAANALDSMEKAAIKSQTENALARADENRRFPDRAYLTSIELGKELAGLTEKWVNDLGENDPGYLSASEFIEDAKALLNGTKHDVN